METVTGALDLPLLQEDLAAAAWEAVEAIARDLQPAAEAPPEEDFTLAGGAAGQALFFAYLDRARPEQGYDEAALDLLERSIEIVGQSSSRPSLYSGFCGVGWTIEHLRDLLLDPDGDDPGEAIPPLVASLLERSPWRRSCDLVNGLVGIGVYACERGGRSGGRDCLAGAVDRLAERAERRPEGITWFTSPDDLPDDTRQMFPAGYYNVGVAHGVPGMIALLAAAAWQGVREAEALRLCEGAVDWLTAQRLHEEALSLYPFHVPAAGPPSRRASRLAWCYGDLGLGAALLAAARTLDRRDWEAEALAAGRRAASRVDAECRVMDAGLCHGAAGIAHLFHRFARATGDPGFVEAARRWFGDTLARRRPGEGVGGFLAYDVEGPGDGCRLPTPGFLEGAAGIGLALLAALTPIAPDWDRLLLASPIGGVGGVGGAGAAGEGSHRPGVGYNRRHG